MQDHQTVELPDFTTYYDATLPNWLSIGVGLIGAALVVIVIIAVILWRSKSGSNQSR